MIQQLFMGYQIKSNKVSKRLNIPGSYRRLLGYIRKIGLRLELLNTYLYALARAVLRKRQDFTTNRFFMISNSLLSFKGANRSH